MRETLLIIAFGENRRGICLFAFQELWLRLRAWSMHCIGVSVGDLYSIKHHTSILEYYCPLILFMKRSAIAKEVIWNSKLKIMKMLVFTLIPFCMTEYVQ